MLVEDMSRNKYSFRGSNITCFTFYIDLWPIPWLSFVNKYLLRMRGPFHDTVQWLGYIASNGNMTHQYWMAKNLEGRASDHIEVLWLSSLKVQRKIIRNFGQNSPCPSRDSNWPPPEYVQCISARMYALKVARVSMIHSHTTVRQAVASILVAPMT
jgi:hypothetical protein